MGEECQGPGKAETTLLEAVSTQARPVFMRDSTPVSAWASALRAGAMEACGQAAARSLGHHQDDLHQARITCLPLLCHLQEGKRTAELLLPGPWLLSKNEQESLFRC